MFQRILSISLVVLGILFIPIFFPTLFPMSADVGMCVAVGLLVLSRPRWAWLVILLTALGDETRSLAPTGIHVVASMVGLGVAVLAHRRLVSGHSQSQVAVLLMIALGSMRSIFMAARFIVVLFRIDWLIPTIANSTFSWVTVSLAAAVCTFVLWPGISRRWLSLQRITYWS